MASTLADIWKAEIEKQQQNKNDESTAAFNQWKKVTTSRIMEEAAKGHSKVVIKAPPKEYAESASDWLRNEQLISIESAKV